MSDNAITATPTRYIRLREVQTLVPLSRTRIYELMAAGRFPACIKLSERASAWSLDEVLAYLAKRREQSRTVAA